MDYRLRKLTTVIQNSRDLPLKTDPCSYFAPLASHRFHPGFKLHVRVDHKNQHTMGVRDLHNVIAIIDYAMARFQGDKVEICMTQEHVQGETWDVTTFMGKSITRVLVAYCQRWRDAWK